MKKYALFLLVALSSCSYLSSEDPYPDYKDLRKRASALCDKIGFVAGSPDFYGCVGTEYTKLKERQPLE